ncbi:B125 [miniopterid betaherpesvirus 1]|uniref:B125 n=1 Tax=miniopterid betaherpesvirus 1 TaxID=3070189 RepID=I3VQC2_9BETA|nr:B125 [miniopterid betaherpesvirus 1]AFK83966.1 B125 [miniopterid betaherpesvirus 1]
MSSPDLADTCNSKSRFIMLNIYGPVDWSSEIPGLSEAFYTDMDNRDFEADLEERRDLNRRWLSVCEKILPIVLTYWKAKILTSEPAQWFAQAECYDDRPLMKLMLQIGAGTSLGSSLSRHLTHMRRLIIARVYEDHHPMMGEWFFVSRTGLSGGNVRVFELDYITSTLLQVTVPIYQWSWTNITTLTDAQLSARNHLFLDRAEEGEDTGSLSEKYRLKPRHRKRQSKGARKEPFRRLVLHLVKLGISNDAQWANKDVSLYMQTMATEYRRNRGKRALDTAVKYILAKKTILDYIVPDECVVREPSNLEIMYNPIFTLLVQQGYDPKEVGVFMLAWMQSSVLGRNVIWLQSPFDAELAAFVSGVLENVPLICILPDKPSQKELEDCVEKMVIWWRSARISKRVSATLIAILSGQCTRIFNGNEFVTVKQTPCIVTSKDDVLSVDIQEHRLYGVRRYVTKLCFEKSVDVKLSAWSVIEFFQWAKGKIFACDLSETLEISNGVAQLKRYGEEELKSRMEDYI